MSRNRQRVKIPQQDTNTNQQVPPPEIVAQQEANPFGLSFVVPTEIVKLPSCGKLYDKDSPLHGLGEVEVKSMTAAEEDIMINESFIEQGIVFDRLIDSLMITPGIRSQDLMDCDKIAVLMSARKTGYGDIIELNTTCGNCGHQYDMHASLSSMLDSISKTAYQPSSGDDWQYLEDSSTFSFSLPTTGLDVNIRLLGPSDVESLEVSKSQKQKLNLPFNETVEFIRAVLVSAQGVTDRTSLNKLAEILPAADARMIRKVHNTNLPKISTTQKTTCLNCSHEEEKEVPFSLGWFWS